MTLVSFCNKMSVYNKSKNIDMSINEQITIRDKFIIEKGKDFTVAEIRILLVRNGFKELGRTRIYQILEDAGITPITKNRKK